MEWKCSGEGRISTNDTAAEVAGCVRDILVALRPLPRLLLSVFPTAYTGPATYPCVANVNGTHDHVNFTKATDIAFMAKMLHAVPDLYTHADFFNSHPYHTRFTTSLFLRHSAALASFTTARSSTLRGAPLCRYLSRRRGGGR